MPTTYKVLGQVAPFALTNTNLYTCPSLTQTVISTITVCNRGGTEAFYRIFVRPNAATLDNSHYLVFDASIFANDTVTLTLGVTMDAADLLGVYASNANLSFNCFGSEIT